MTSRFLLAAMAGSVFVWISSAPLCPIQSGEEPRFELRPNENYFRIDGRPTFVLGRNPAGMNPQAYDDHFRHAAAAGERFMRIHFTYSPPSEKAGEVDAGMLMAWDAVFYGSGGNFTAPAQEQGLWEFVQGGGGLAGVHATDAFKDSDVYWKLLGGRFTTHGGGKFMLRIEDKKHPITAGMDDFEISDETYQNKNHPEAKMHNLGRIDRGNEQQSMVWVQEFGKGRVFNTTLGHGQQAFDNPQFQRLVVRGLYWAAKRQPKDP